MKHYFRKNKLRDTGITLLVLLLAFGISRLLLPKTGVENNSALIFEASVVIISFLTDGYVYGIVASIIGVFSINIFFMVPYGVFNLSSTGYTVATISMLISALIVCTLTTRLKQHAAEAEEREQKTRELYEMNAKLEKEKTQIEIAHAKNSVRSNILLAVSHDLRTPLTAISGSASYILSERKSEIPEDCTKMIEDIKTDADWLSVMVQNILSVTRVNDMQKSLKLRPEIPEEIIGSSIAKISRRFPESKISFAPPEKIVLAMMDPLLIEQVLINLIENAVRHSGSVKPIEVSLEYEGGKVRFLVRDHGRGLPEDILNQIAEDSPVMVDRRGDSVRGMGIGLSVCQSILKAHDSRLFAVDTGEGTCFYFSLNAAEDSTYAETEDTDR